MRRTRCRWASLPPPVRVTRSSLPRGSAPPCRAFARCRSCLNAPIGFNPPMRDRRSIFSNRPHVCHDREGGTPPAAATVPPGVARGAPRSSAPALAIICSIVEILMRTASLIHTIRLLQMIRSARRTAGAHEVSAVVQHCRADESTGRVKQHRWLMLIPPAPTLEIFPFEFIKSSNACQSRFLHRHSSQPIDYVVQELRNHRAESGKESA